MKNFVLLSLMAGSLSFYSCSGDKSAEKAAISDSANVSADASVASAGKKYPVKSGIITYETQIHVGGAKIEEKKVLYFDDYGMKEAEETFEGGALTKTYMSDGEFLFNLVHADKTAYRGEKATRGVAYRFDWNEVSQEDKDAGKAKKVPGETIAGKDCEAYSIESNGTKTRFAGWNNITLLTEQESEGMKTVTRAVKVEETEVPAEKLSLPADYTLKEK